MSKNDGGLAFPFQASNGMEMHEPSYGMSQRDYFAGHALAGMLAHSTRYRPRSGASDNWHEAISEEAYQIADAMLTAREGGAS